MEIQVNSLSNLVFDQEYMKSLDSVYAPAFKNLQQEFDKADDFDNSKCLDFSSHPQFDRSGGSPKRLPLSFTITLCSVFSIFQRAWMKQNIHEKVRLHFKSARDVGEF
eukprot:TRINITY_DN4199_c0_g2_i1.p2 TRINITY_DN4199_c0_g2~~TRINITY_DN4199_c0_g2_i1.p2  ORF type:complete len:108 (-),score=14.47 TRINITY_DN4199_c0_g2_i1:1226-1549(-)